MTLKEKIEDMNNMILSGQMMKAFKKYNHKELSIHEDIAPPTVGKDAYREREIESMGMIEEFHGLEINSWLH
ncbi:MAG TPA: hypothetical protein PKN99_01815 [Cyclobacteriaceae bacterium]|jgi:hypothetical protein|nr:hypothetical protein [Cyclobacteriaceae bacterium]